MRYGRDEYDADEYVRNGYDYILQVWVRDGVIQDCAHPPSMREGNEPCCTANALRGQSIRVAREARS